MTTFESETKQDHRVDIDIVNGTSGSKDNRWGGRPRWQNLHTRAVRVRDIAEGVREITLERIDGRSFPAWVPGSHIDLHVGGLVRQYSLCGPIEDLHHLQVAVGLAPNSRGGSQWVHADLSRGDELEVGGLRNNFPFLPADGYQFIAGGIGITPLLSMVAGAEFARRPWRLDYGGRTRASMAYAEEVAGIQPGCVSVVPEDQGGMLDLRAIVSRVPADHLIYACGPAAMLVALREVCADRGVADQLRTESFTPIVEQGPIGRADDEFDVLCAREGSLVRVRADQSILEALEESGLNPEYGCREGTCASCEVAVLDGIPDHRDSVLTDAEKAGNDCIMICTSRSCTPRLVIDL